MWLHRLFVPFHRLLNIQKWKHVRQLKMWPIRIHDDHTTPKTGRRRFCSNEIDIMARMELQAHLATWQLESRREGREKTIELS